MILKRISNLLKKIFQENEAPAAGGTVEVAARLEQRVLALVDNMPALPATATRAMAIANDPDSNFIDLAGLIEGDAAIATALLRFANSAFFAGGAPAVKLDKAVGRLGMFRSKQLILSIGMKSMFQKMDTTTKDQCAVLWHHGYVTGFLCGRINRAFRLGFDGDEFSAGLLHDLGRILLIMADPDCAERAATMDFVEESDKLECERAAIGIDHCALGAWFGEHSRLPESLIGAMRWHHNPDFSKDSQKLAALVATADHMANHLQRGEETKAYNPEENAGLTGLWDRWPPARRDRFKSEISAMMDESAQAAAAAASA